MHNKLLPVILACLFALPMYGAWMPIVNNYEVEDYQAGAQNWGIAAQSNGWIYVANNYGLLEYDGCQWRLFGLSNSTAVRCVTIESERIYVGGRNQYGYFTPNQLGEMSYTSLSDSLPASHKDFGEVWRIIPYQNDLFIQTRQLLICHINGQTQIIDPGAVIEATAMVNGSLYIATSRDIYILVGNRLHALHGLDCLHGSVVSQMIEMNGNLLIATDCNGLFIYDGETIRPFYTDIDSYLRRNQIYTMATYEQRLIIGTVQQGILILSNQGHILHRITRSEGLQNNTVLSLCVHGNSLWAGLDKGISRIFISQDVFFLNDVNTDYGSGYTYCEYHGENYWGTNHGIYYQSSPESQLKFIDGSQGQVWSLDIVGNQLFCAHNKGLYLMQNHHLQPILSEGCWHVKAIDSTHAVVGSYNGFYYLKYESHKWQCYQLKGFNETAFHFSYDKEQRAILVQTSNGIKCFDIDLHNLRLMQREIDANDYTVDKNGDVVSAQSAILYDYPRRYLSEKHLLIDGFYHGYITKDSFIVAGGLDGFYRFSKNTPPCSEQQLYIRQVFITSPYRKMIYGESYVQPSTTDITLTPNTYTLNFTFSGSNTSEVTPRFATRLWPVEKEFGNYSSNPSWFFAGLHPGKYRLDVKMLDGLTESTWSRSINITIMLPYYRRGWALCIYFILFLALIGYLTFRIRLYAKEKAERIQQEKDQELQQQQMQILQLEKNQTQNKLKNKSQELSHMLLSEANRKEWSQNVLGDLRRITDLLNSENYAEAKTRTQALQSKLIRNAESGLDWKRFEVNFDLVHEQFITHLKEHYPWMSKQERQLCIYIKMGLLTKEIAPLMNISVRGVEMLRYRMRQKMGLPESANIKKWLDEIK